MGRGGARPGAGRKPLHKERLVYFRLGLSREQLDYLRTKGNVSDFIRKIIELFSQKEKENAMENH